MRCHQALSASASGLVLRSESTLSMSLSTGFTWPTMGTSTFTFLEMEAGSTSMWITLAWGQNCASLPVTRSSKPGADGDDEVRLVHGHVGLVGAVCIPSACRDCSEVGGRHRAEPDECLCNGETGLLHQLAQLVGGIALDDAAATVDHRALGLYHEIHGLANLLGMPFSTGL